MDPLSVTLGVIALTTAVRDLAELGQKIHESFAKVSKNLRSAQRVAENIKEMVDEIEVFCDRHKDMLGNMKDFGVALRGLLSKFRKFETSILPLLPRIGRRKLGHLIRGWWNNNKIQESISDLESNIVKLMRGYMLKSALRTEVKLETIHQETSRGLTGITQGLEVVRRDVSALRITTESATTHRLYGTGRTSDELNRNIVMFAQSTPSTAVPMLRTPNMITEELMTTAYIKLQINSIAMLVEEMSMAPAVTANNAASNTVAPLHFSMSFEPVSTGITHLRRHVVRQLTHICDLLDTQHIHTISIEDGARALNRLSFGLQTLGLTHESILVGNWAITLARTLFGASGGAGGPAFGAMLALHLCNQSWNYYHHGDNMQSLRTVEEAFTVTQNLWNQYGAEVDFQIMYSDILLQYSQLVDTKRSINMSLEAIQVLENVLNIQVFTHPTSHKKIESAVKAGSSLIDQLFSSAPPLTAIRSYTLALRRLGAYLFTDGHPENAVNLFLLALILHRKTVSVYGPDHRADLALALLWLVQSKIARDCIPAEQHIKMTDECIHILRELAGKNPISYARKFVDVLWVKASTLERLDRRSEAITTWEEVVTLSGQIVQDSELCARALGNLSDQFRRLKRHNDALRTLTLAINTYQKGTADQARRYFCLSKDLQQLQRYKESVEAARTSVTLYRQLEMGDPGTWMGRLTENLSNLAHCLAASGDHSQALIPWKESVRILDNFLNSSPDTSLAINNAYLVALRTHTMISHVLEDEEESLKISSTTAQYLCRLSDIYQQNTDIILDLFRADLQHVYNMLLIGRLQDARQHIDQWCEARNSKSQAVSESVIALWHAAMMHLKAEALDAQGSTEQALSVIQAINDIPRVSPSDCQRPFAVIVGSMQQESRLQVNLGNAEKALQIAEEALQLCRDNKTESNSSGLLVWSCRAVAFAALSCYKYRRAVEAAQEGCNILITPDGLNYWQSNGYVASIYPSLFTILASAVASLGGTSSMLKYAHRAVDTSLEVRDVKAYVSASTAEHSYMEARGVLAEILLSTGDIAQAQQICKERRAYFFKRVEKRMGEYRDLAPVLRMLGILCCSDGHHKEGDAAAKELSHIMKTLGNAFPSLQEQVKLRLRHQTKMPILKVLNDMCQKLDCGHQTKVLLLF